MPPKKKSPMKIIGIVAGALVVLVIIIVLVFVFAFRAPLLPNGKTGDLYGSAIPLGSGSVSNAHKLDPAKTFNEPGTCNTGSKTAVTPATEGYVAGDTKTGSMMTFRFDDTKGADSAYNGLAATLKDCSVGSNLKISQPTFNKQSLNGASYQTFDQTSNGQKTLELMVVEYGNTVSLAQVKSLGDPQATVKALVANYQKAAKS